MLQTRELHEILPHFKVNPNTLFDFQVPTVLPLVTHPQFKNLFGMLLTLTVQETLNGDLIKQGNYFI